MELCMRTGQLSRRALLAAGVSLTLAACTPAPAPSADPSPTPTPAPTPEPSALPFAAVGTGRPGALTLPPEYTYRVLLGWGDPVLAGAGSFDLAAQTESRQRLSAGYEPAATALLPLDAQTPIQDRALLWVSHAGTDPTLMFADYARGRPTPDQVAIQLAAVGGTVLEVTRGGDGQWVPVLDSPRNRRVTGTDPILLTGPLAGHPSLRTRFDPQGTRAEGLLGSRTATATPWGTFLAGETTADRFFGDFTRDRYPEPLRRELESYQPRTDIAQADLRLQQNRFSLSTEPQELCRFGYVVEVDPGPQPVTVRKHTALGRLRHSGLTVRVSGTGRVVVYTADAQTGHCWYKFISAGRVGNADLLERGTLYAARFDPGGSGAWLPLTHGTGALAAPAFTDPADVLLRTREAARAVGATALDAPVATAVRPGDGQVWLALSGDPDRTTTDAANPRRNNRWGHLIAVSEAGGDPAALSFGWEIPVRCGDPSDTGSDPYFAGLDPARCSPVAAVDSLAFDPTGVAWLGTSGQPEALRKPEQVDGLSALVTTGAQRGLLSRFVAGLSGSALTGLTATPDGTALIAAVPSPGRGSTLPTPSESWPDTRTAGTARPAVIALTRTTAKAPLLGR
ncbi:PhoX family protein [Granulicoccus phenolivorans]|uniref:PhoX family protein n=1 Tax=Granulicoccus phenolivorans TaxID=266854 RepID=UPI00041C2876|nr:alkaline phosphatase PhoX [Granulicoccus phenolivorans]